MIKKLVKLKEKAFQYGLDIFTEMGTEFNLHVDKQNLAGVEQYKDKFIGLNVIDVTNWIYNNPKFYDYLKYVFLAKHYEKKLNLIQLLIILPFLIFGIISYLIFGFNLTFIIISIVLILILVFIFSKLKTGESYKSYYNRTMLDFLLKVYGLEFSINNVPSLTDDDLHSIINNRYDKKILHNDMVFSSNLSNGKILDLELIKTIEHKDKNGNVRKSSDKIFDGFYLNLDIANHGNLLKGNVIKIRADENILSSLTEDTVSGIYESQRAFSFNSEEMNKSFDCKVSGYSGFNDVDDMLITVHKIITPSFEQHLLYLRERYNTFNMNISDSGIVATFNMERSFFQKAKHNEIMDFKTTYREANEKFRMLKADLNGINDFAYYNVFPFLERLYLIKYLTYLYLSYMDFNNYYDLNNENINNFEMLMKDIFTMKNKEFREIHIEKIKEVKNSVKEFIGVFEKEN